MREQKKSNQRAGKGMVVAGPRVGRHRLSASDRQRKPLLAYCIHDNVRYAGRVQNPISIKRFINDSAFTIFSVGIFGVGLGQVIGRLTGIG